MGDLTLISAAQSLECQSLSFSLSVSTPAPPSPVFSRADLLCARDSSDISPYTTSPLPPVKKSPLAGPRAQSGPWRYWRRSSEIEGHQPSEVTAVPRWKVGSSGCPPGGPDMSNGYRTLSQHLNDLKKENFSLKLRIYFLEERIQQKYEDSSEDVYRRVGVGLAREGFQTGPMQKVCIEGGVALLTPIFSRGAPDQSHLFLNIELKVEVESLKQELQEKQQLLDKALRSRFTEQLQENVVPVRLSQCIGLPNPKGQSPYPGTPPLTGAHGLVEHTGCTLLSVGRGQEKRGQEPCCHAYAFKVFASTAAVCARWNNLSLGAWVTTAESLTNHNEAELQRRCEERQQEIDHMQEILETKIQLLQEEAKLARSEAERMATLAESRSLCQPSPKRSMKEAEEEEETAKPPIPMEDRDRVIEELSLALRSKEALIVELRDERGVLRGRVGQLESQVQDLSTSLQQKERDAE
ncbi:hypothetical protein JZ751_025828, partial [Albula glossodonta]